MFVIFKCLQKGNKGRNIWEREGKPCGKICWVEKFAEVLVEPVNGFAFRLDRVALKKSSNNEVYEHMRKSFMKN